MRFDSLKERKEHQMASIVYAILKGHPAGPELEAVSSHAIPTPSGINTPSTTLFQ